MTRSLEDLVETRSIIVCCGSGGVGKTTAAAAIAMHGARQGLRACVVTIDPAKRLADALGLDALTNAPGRIDGPWRGELWALMLDTKGTFDELVTRHAATPAQAQSILANHLYRNISGALSGTQEYMAMEKLYELYHEGAPVDGAPAGQPPTAPVADPTDLRTPLAAETSGGGGRQKFDVIVVDTPPTRNALDFLDAPRRLTSFLDNRIFRLLVTPTRAYLRAVSMATQTLLRAVAKVVGSEVVGDAITFFNAFEGMEEGFRVRADAVLQLLADERTAFVVITSPRRDAVEEAAFFADRLADAGIAVDALVVNRLHPRFGTQSPPADTDDGGPNLGTLSANLADFRKVAEREEQNFAQLAGRVAPAPVSRIPFLAGDVHDLEGLAVVERFLFPEPPTLGDEPAAGSNEPAGAPSSA